MTLLTPRQRKIADYIKDNSELLAVDAGIAGKVIERMECDLHGMKFVDQPGYDGFCSIHGRVEIKSTHTVLACGRLRYGNIRSKRNECDWILLVDGVHERRSWIPHDRFFAVAEDRNEVYISASYNQTDQRCVAMTQLFLEFER